jgi:hypothetical protein
MCSRTVAVSIAVVATVALGTARPVLAKSASPEIRKRCPCAGPDSRTFWSGIAERLACVERAIPELAAQGWPASLLDRARVRERRSRCGVRRFQCGLTSTRRCPRGMVCEVLDPHCRPDGAPGTCVSRRLPHRSCRDNPYPMCGCDGATYVHECAWRRAGVALAHSGACALGCAGPDRVACPAGETCYALLGCDGADARGACGDADASCAPGGTPEPACGCDGVTYPSMCEVAAGVALRHGGACATP